MKNNFKSFLAHFALILKPSMSLTPIRINARTAKLNAKDATKAILYFFFNNTKKFAQADQGEINTEVLLKRIEKECLKEFLAHNSFL